MLRALTLRPDLRVLLLDRAAFPRDKTCGDGVGPRSVALLRGLGVAHVLAGGRWLHRLRVRGPFGTVASGTVEDPGVVLPRTVLDARLVAAVRDRGVELLQHRVRHVEQVTAGVVLDGRFAAPIVVGADGANSVVRRSVVLALPARRHSAVALRAYAEVPHAPPELAFHFTSEPWPCYVWCFPGPGGRANVGVVALDGRLPIGRESFATLLEREFQGTALVAGVEVDPATIRGHHLPLSTARQPARSGAVLLAGDAASLINPLSGEGIATALMSGMLAGEAALTGHDRAGEVYAASLRRRLGRHLRHSRAAARLFASPSITTGALRAAAARPNIFAELVDLSVGTGPLSTRTVLQIGIGHARDRGRSTTRAAEATEEQIDA